MRKEWEEAHTVTEELVEGPPSRRANATLTPCPNGNHLWCIGGEFFSEDGKAVRKRFLTGHRIKLIRGPSTFTMMCSDTHPKRMSGESSSRLLVQVRDRRMP